MPSLSRFGFSTIVSVAMMGCSTFRPFTSARSEYLTSGTIIISHMVPERPEDGLAESTSEQATAGLASLQSAELSSLPLGQSSSLGSHFAPLVGYFPASTNFVPAENETWLQIDSRLAKVAVYRGQEVVKEFSAEGPITVDPGEYFVQHKQKEPLWYAPNEYFTKRQLAIPSPDDRLRYRRGALGKYAVYLTTTFPIHCAPLWTDDVGGLRVSQDDLASIYYMLPVGSPIVVR